ncbi:hypothetical protein CHCC14568_1320 [Bacillus licheniformis]|nr:hypothetical protein CHCC14568_1320 [Bacillus licheniformis]
MSTIQKTNGEFGIFHEAGMQAKGSFTPNSDGLTPIELLEASLGMCITISLQKMFERDGIEVLEDEFPFLFPPLKPPKARPVLKNVRLALNCLSIFRPTIKRN